MDNKVKYFFEVLDRTGVAMSDISEIMSISRKTLYSWKAGSNVTDKLRRDIAYGYAVRLDKAHKVELLPLANRYKRVERIALLRKIIAGSATK